MTEIRQWQLGLVWEVVQVVYKSITDQNSRQAKLQEFFYRELQKRDQDALLTILNSESGRWFLMRLLDKTKVNADNFTGNSQTFYNEGMRKVGLLILNDIQNLGITGVKLKQKAELEYINTQTKAQKIVAEQLEGDDE